MTKNDALRKGIFALLACLLGAVAAPAQDLRLAAPPEMVESGFFKHLLPRFKLKHRIAVEPVAPGAEAELVLSAEGQGVRVFADGQGAEYRLRLTGGGAQAETFRKWLRSAPGRAAIEGFPRDGPPAYVTEFAAEAVEAGPEIDGDAVLGAKLALVHCGRCHVVDHRNPMGGIGSTPSFAAMRARPHWVDLFGKYWSENPHPSFTEVVGVTKPFDKTHVSHIVPVQITLEEIDAILAFVETLEPLNLGAPVLFD